MRLYIYVNWKTKDVVTTTSVPGSAAMHQQSGDYFKFSNSGVFYNEHVAVEPQVKAKKLYADGYEYVGYVAGLNIINIVKPNAPFQAIYCNSKT